MTTLNETAKTGVSTASRDNTFCGNWSVIYVVTLNDNSGFYYLLDADTNRWTTEHDDALAFATDQDATNVASTFGLKGVSVLCSARKS